MASSMIMGHACVVGMSMLVGNNEVRKALANRLLTGPSKNDFGLSVPFQDFGVAIGEDHGVQCGFDHRFEQVLAVRQVVQCFGEVLGAGLDFLLHALGQAVVGLALF